MAQRDVEASAILDWFTDVDEMVRAMHQDMNTGFNNLSQQISQSGGGVGGGTPQTGQGPFAENMAPAFAQGEYVHLRPIGDTYQVKLVEVQPGVDVTLNVNANGMNSDQSADPLQVDDGMLAQYRVMDGTDIRDGVTIEADQLGQQSVMYKSKNQRGDWGTDTSGLTPQSNLTELFQFEDRDLHFTVTETNGDGSNLTVTFSGFMYRIVGPVNDVSPTATVWNVPVGPSKDDPDFYQHP